MTIHFMVRQEWFGYAHHRCLTYSVGLNVSQGDCRNCKAQFESPPTQLAVSGSAYHCDEMCCMGRGGYSGEGEIRTLGTGLPRTAV